MVHHLPQRVRVVEVEHLQVETVSCQVSLGGHTSCRVYDGRPNYV